jgi:hypothetical protein
MRVSIAANSLLAGVPVELAGIPPAYLLTVELPWPKENALRLKSFFPWEGIDSAVRAGFYGTSVGQRHGEPCIRLYCNKDGQEYFSHKMREFDLNAVVDFAIGGPISFAGASTVPGGSKIRARAGMMEGTLGGWLRSVQLDTVGISNNHVAADFNNFWQRDVVVSFPKGTNGPIAIGQLARVEPIRAYDSSRNVGNLVDVAFFIPFDNQLVDRTIDDKIPQGEADLIALWDAGVKAEVWMLGQASAEEAERNGTDPVQRGHVTAVHAVAWWDRPPRKYFFEEQIEISISAKHGDSGSLVLTQGDDKIGGLFFAYRPGINAAGLINPWSSVKILTGLDFVYRPT